MKISIKWFGNQFNVGLANDGKDEFLSIKGCRLISGPKGEFVSWPSAKKDDGTYWKHVWGSDEFQAAVIREAKKSQPQEPVKQRDKAEAWKAGAPVNDDVPF